MSDHVEVLRTLRDRLPRAGRWLHEIDALNAAIDSLRQVPEGYVLAPIVPTDEMLRAMGNARRDREHPDYRGPYPADSAAYAAALADVPNPATPTSGGRKFRGIGELERSGYIPEGSADEREATPAQAGAELPKADDDALFVAAYVGAIASNDLLDMKKRELLSRAATLLREQYESLTLRGG